MEEDDDNIVAMVAMTCASAAATYIKVYGPLAAPLQVPRLPLLRFVRPSMPYMTYLQVQEAVLADNADRIMFDMFRINTASLHALVDIAAPFIRGNISAKEVVCVTLQWLATGASVRCQEQFFLDKGYSTIHQYRVVGLEAILKGNSRSTVLD